MGFNKLSGTGWTNSHDANPANPVMKFHRMPADPPLHIQKLRLPHGRGVTLSCSLTPFWGVTWQTETHIILYISGLFFLNIYPPSTHHFQPSFNFLVSLLFRPLKCHLHQQSLPSSFKNKHSY